MKYSVISVLTAFCLVHMTFSLHSLAQPGNSSRVLSYVESNNGLTSLEWEGGRTELEFADMDQDGHLDIISIGDHGSPFINTDEHGIMVYFGDGQGNWSLQMTGDLGYGGIAAGDVNNDGLMDVGYAMHHNYSGTDFGDQLIEVALGDGTGTAWTPWDNGLAANGEDYGMFSTDFADIDNDGDLDLGSVSFGCCNGVHVYLNHLDGTWTQSYSMVEGNSDMIFQFGDMDNDGAMDFIAGYQNGTAYFGDGEGGFTLNDQNLPPGGTLGRYGPSLGDVDGDGGMDLAFTNNNGGVFIYTFSEMLNSWVNFSGNLPVSGPYEHTQLADMNMDGFIDLAAYGEGTFQLFLGDGSGTWTADATFTTGDPGYSQAFRVGGDFDHNGRPDIVLLEEEQLSWFTYQNYLKCYKESSTAVLLSIRPVFPYGSELLRPGSVRFIDWVNAVPGNETAEVNLEYSTTGPEGPWTVISSQLPDNGRYQWIVPQGNSDNCFIRYSISDGTNNHASITPAAFIITDGTIGWGETAIERIDLEVFPNPANEQLAVIGPRSTAGDHRSYNIHIADLYGRAIKDFEDVSSFPFLINVADLRDGIYILQMTGAEGATASAKFLKTGEQ